MEDGARLGPHDATSDGAAPGGQPVDATARRATLERARAAIRASVAMQARNAANLGYAAGLAADAARLRERSAAGRAEQAELRGAMGDYVRRLRADGVPPQSMLVLVKEALRESTPAGLAALEAREALTAEVVRWSVEAYYDAI